MSDDHHPENQPKTPAPVSVPAPQPVAPPQVTPPADPTVATILSAMNSAQQQGQQAASMVADLQKQVAQLEAQNAATAKALKAAEDAAATAKQENLLRDVAADLGKLAGENAPPVDTRIASLAVAELGDQIGNAEALKAWRDGPKQKGLFGAAASPRPEAQQPGAGSSQRGGNDEPERLGEYFSRLGSDEKIPAAERAMYERASAVFGGPGALFRTKH